MFDNERAYYVCNTCSYGVSGHTDSPTFLNKVDNHEEENPGHRMVEAKDY